MLSFKYRFHGHGGMKYLFRNGRTARSHLMTVRAVENTKRKYPRYAVIVSRKVCKSAVGRNRIRRRLYEIIRTEMLALKNNGDLVVIASTSEIKNIPADELLQAVKQLFNQLNLYK